MSILYMWYLDVSSIINILSIYDFQQELLTLLQMPNWRPKYMYVVHLFKKVWDHTLQYLFFINSYSILIMSRTSGQHAELFLVSH